MSRSSSISSLIKSAAAPALALLVVAIFAGNALLGTNGLFAWGDYKRKLAERQVELKQLEGDRLELANRVALLDPKGTDPDYADELVRRQTLQIRDDEVVILTR